MGQIVDGPRLKSHFGMANVVELTAMMDSRHYHVGMTFRLYVIGQLHDDSAMLGDNGSLMLKLYWHEGTWVLDDDAGNSPTVHPENVRVPMVVRQIEKQIPIFKYEQAVTIAISNRRMTDNAEVGVPGRSRMRKRS